MRMHITFHPYRQTIITTEGYFSSTKMEITCAHMLFFIHSDRTKWPQLPVFQTDTAFHHIHYLSFYTVCHPICSNRNCLGGWGLYQSSSHLLTAHTIGREKRSLRRNMIRLHSHHELIPTTGCNLNYTVWILALNVVFKNNTTALEIQ